MIHLQLLKVNTLFKLDTGTFHNPSAHVFSAGKLELQLDLLIFYIMDWFKSRMRMTDVGKLLEI
jgi:hypothetical protein